MRTEHIKLTRKQVLKNIIQNIEKEEKKRVAVTEFKIVYTEVFIQL